MIEIIKILKRYTTFETDLENFQLCIELEYQVLNSGPVHMLRIYLALSAQISVSVLSTGPCPRFRFCLSWCSVSGLCNERERGGEEFMTR